MPPINDQCRTVSLKNFKIDAETILSELSAYHVAKKRLIEHTFQKLFDNLPASIKDMPANQCMSDYAAIVSEKASIIADESLNDEDMGQDGWEFVCLISMQINMFHIAALGYFINGLRVVFLVDKTVDKYCRQIIDKSWNRHIFLSTIF